MESLKIDLRGFSESQKNSVVSKLKSLGYSGNPRTDNFFFYCIYASGVPSSHGYSLGFGNNMKTFNKNKGKEITLDELDKMIDS